MKVALILDLAHDATLLQQIVGNLRTHWLTTSVEHDFKIFSLEDW